MAASPAPLRPAHRPWRALFGLPLMALGIAALIPGRVAGLLPLLESPPVAARPAGAPAQPVPLREGLVAVPTVTAMLAGPNRSSPVGDDRPVDARMLAELTRRQAEIERREREAELREMRAGQAEERARAQISTLQSLRDELERLVLREGEAANADLDSLVALYVNMRPQQAAKVLERLEAGRAATILLRIPDRLAGPILAQMDPQSALAVTQEIAGRREAFRR